MPRLREVKIRHSVRLKEVSVQEEDVGDAQTKREKDLDKQARERHSARLKEMSVKENNVGVAQVKKEKHIDGQANECHSVRLKEVFVQEEEVGDAQTVFLAATYKFRCSFGQFIESKFLPLCVCMYDCMYVCMYVMCVCMLCMYVCMYAMYVCMYTCMLCTISVDALLALPFVYAFVACICKHTYIMHTQTHMNVPIYVGMWRRWDT